MSREHSLRRWMPFVVLVLGLGFTAAGCWQLNRAYQARERERFARRIAVTKGDIAKRMEAYLVALRSTAGLFASSEYVSQDEFRRFVIGLGLEEHYPGVQGIGFAETAAAFEASRLQQRIRNEVMPDFVLPPVGDRAEVSAVMYIEPLNERNRAAIGSDMLLQPTLRKAMERARDSGGPAATGRVLLGANGAGEPGVPGFYIYVPVYAGRETPSTSDEGRSLVAGYVYCPFRAHELFGQLFDGDQPPAEFSVRSNRAEETEAELYASPGFAAAHRQFPEFEADGVIEIAGRTWPVVFRPGDGFASGTLPTLVPVIAGAGTLLTLLLVGVVRGQARAADRAESIAAELRSSQAELTRSEARKSAILESALDAIVSIDHAGLVTEWNPAAERIFGIPRTRAIGQNLGDLIVPDSARARHSEGISRYLSTGEALRLGRRLETTALRADGSEFPVELSVTRIAAQEPASFTGFIRDITLRKRAEDHQQWITRELDHRVKNNLATVLAIVDQSARGSQTITDFREAVTGRLRALARLHDMLAAKRWEGADMDELVSRMVSPFTLGAEGRISASGDPIVVPGKVASSLCMSLHELATNAAKYGALSIDAGFVDIRWTRQLRDGRPWVVLNWTERGGPAVREPERRGFGTLLILDGLAFEVGGRSAIEYDPSGVRCTLEAPLDRVEVAHSPPDA